MIRVALFDLIVVYFPILFQINIYYKSTYSNQVSLSYVAIYVTKVGLLPNKKSVFYTNRRWTRPINTL